MREDMKSLFRSLASIPREIVENTLLFILPVSWGKRYLDWRLESCDARRIHRRILILTKMISVSERAGDIRAAEVAARHILSIDPEDLCVPVELAIILEKQGRLSEARQLYQRIVAAPSVSAAYRAKALSEVERLTALEG
jgi:hypothetical protein